MMNKCEEEILNKYRTILLNHSKKYVNMIFGLNCIDDLLKYKLFPNTKEFTESMGMFYNVKKHSKIRQNEKNVALLSIGDGSTPRTAGLFAFLTKWDCYSIDPNLRWMEETEEGIQDIRTINQMKYKEIKRLNLIKKKAEDVDYSFLSKYDKLVVVCVHSHAKIQDFIHKIRGKFDDKYIFLSSMPCCVKQIFMGLEPHIIRDLGILSPKNEILNWKIGGEYGI